MRPRATCQATSYCSGVAAEGSCATQKLAAPWPRNPRRPATFAASGSGSTSYKSLDRSMPSARPAIDHTSRCESSSPSISARRRWSPASVPRTLRVSGVGGSPAEASSGVNVRLMSRSVSVASPTARRVANLDHAPFDRRLDRPSAGLRRRQQFGGAPRAVGPPRHADRRMADRDLRDLRLAVE